MMGFGGLGCRLTLAFGQDVGNRETVKGTVKAGIGAGFPIKYEVLLF